MSIIKPFKAYRPKKGLEEKIASRPYDVLNSKEAKEEAKNNEYSFLHIVKSEIDLTEDINIYDLEVYKKASDNLQKLISEDSLIQEEKNALYIYAQKMGEHIQYGLVGCASIDDYAKNIIKIHEKTRQAKENDRIRHVDTTNANTGPVFLTYQANADIDQIINEFIKNKPEYDFISDDGIGHTLWVISDDKIIEKIVNIFKSNIPELYVADGHHRSKSAYEVGKKRRKVNPNHTGDEEYNGFLAVFFPHNQLKILDYNRVVKDLNGLSEKELLAKIDIKFILEPQKALYKPSQTHILSMYLKGQWYKLTVKEGIFDENDPVERLDISILQNNILSSLLGIHNPRTSERIDFVGGIRGLEELQRRVDNGEMVIAFALYPTSIEELMAIADADKIMPPKSTWFEPKLRSGLLIHTLD